MSFAQKLQHFWNQKKFVSLGLDPEFEKIPESVKRGSNISDAIFYFNKAIIDATHDIVLGYKIQAAFYEAMGEDGHRAMKMTAEYILKNFQQHSTILDAKRADIANTNIAYAKAAFDELGFDAVTIHPYLGKEAVKPFLERKEKGVFVLVRTSNPGADEFQDLIVDGEPLYVRVAKNVATSWNENNNVGIVVGATYPAELEKLRSMVGEMPILIPGIGTQGGDAGKAFLLGKNSKSEGVIITASRSLIFASDKEDFANATRVATISLSNAIAASN